MRYHFSGVAGQGMNPLARLMRSWGHEVQGSDRSIDQGRNEEAAAYLVAAGVDLRPQDGLAIDASLDRFVYSAAVEADTPEMRAARAADIPMLARPTLLAEVVNAGVPGVAIAGTSGKSTVTGMIGWILSYAGLPHTLLGGAALQGEGLAGGFHPGPVGGPVIAEACESDGTLPGYVPGIGLVHNITRDHAELEALHRQFAAFASHCGLLFVNADCRVASTLEAAQRITYGADGGADVPWEPIAVGPDRARGLLRLPSGDEIDLDLPQPGLHTLCNAVAAALVAHRLGVESHAIGEALVRFPGVSRRFEVVGITDTGIRVVDDYAHNGDKIRAAIRAAQAGCERLVAVFQPHGFNPARFLRPELRDLIPSLLRPEDVFAYGPIYYSGGTVAKDISSADLAADIGCAHCEDRQAVLRWVSEEARPGDTVLSMGARDPELPRLARAIHDLL